MRENMGLYRGKRKDNGEWIEGSLLKVTISGETYYLIFCDDFALDGFDVKALSHAIVDPETIGEYTGLPDKNGKRIFEGDILCLKTNSGGKHYDVVVAERWNCSCCEGVFGFSTEHGDVDVDIRDHNHAEVIGNVHDHDNPELLEVSGDD